MQGSKQNRGGTSKKTMRKSNFGRTPKKRGVRSSDVQKFKQFASEGKTTIIRNMFAADNLIADLTYVIPYQSVVTAAGTLANIRFTSNAYDVDTSLGSTSMAGFAEYAIIYSRFRTLEMKYQISFANQETFPIGVMAGFMTNALSSTGLGANFCENPHMKGPELIGPLSGAGTHRFSGSCGVAQLFGAKQPFVDDTFTGSTTSSTLPATSTMNLYFGTVGAAGMNGCIVQGRITLTVQFFRRNAIFSREDPIQAAIFSDKMLRMREILNECETGDEPDCVITIPEEIILPAKDKAVEIKSSLDYRNNLNDEKPIIGITNSLLPFCIKVNAEIPSVEEEAVLAKFGYAKK